MAVGTQIHVGGCFSLASGNHSLYGVQKDFEQGACISNQRASIWCLLAKAGSLEVL